MGAEKARAAEAWWIERSRVDFSAYRQFMRSGDFLHGWFIESMALAFQRFYVNLKAGKRPILIITCPPQSGKSWAVEDFASWIAGLDPDIRMVYASFSEYLGIRCNAGIQRAMTTDKYRKIFPDTNINSKNTVTIANEYRKNSTQIEFINRKGSFRNTTVGGPITGEALDVGFVDDFLKGRKEANSQLMRNNVWNWFLDDFGTRFSDKAGYIITMTRWHVDDPVGRLIEKYKNDPGRISLFKYSAIAEQDELHRKEGEALFPELKSLEFLEEKKSLMMNASWQSLYQGNPVVEGGELIDKRWYQWWEALPQLKYTYAVADTAQKKNNWNDYTVFQLWGMGVDGCIYLLDMLHDKITAPELRRHGEIFYRKHSHNRYGGTFRGFCIEDKSSGIGLIQEFEEKKFKVFPIPRNTDKIERSMNIGPEIRAGKVYLNASIPHIEKVLEQTEQFPHGSFDDAFDTLMSGIEVAYIYPEILNNTVFVG